MLKKLLLAALLPLRWLLRLLLALLILFEEWGWVPLARAMAWLGRLPFLAWIERRVRALPPYAALAVLLLPSLLLLPVKLLALWLIGIGRAGLGLVVIVLAKVIGTAIVARLFMLTQPALMQLAWFAKLYGRWVIWKAGLRAWVQDSLIWRESRRIKQALREAWGRWRSR